MMRYKNYLLFFLAAAITTGCAAYKAQYNKEAQGWEKQQLPEQLTKIHTLFMLGDAGKANEHQQQVLALMEEKMKAEQGPKTLVYLGDNIYEKGLPPKSDSAAYQKALSYLQPQIDLANRTNTRTYAVAGNHDWALGIEALNRQENYWEDALGYDDVFLPKAGNGDPEEIELSEDLVLILIDTEWYLHNWNKTPEVNVDGEIKSRNAFMIEFLDALTDNRSKDIIVAMHHPLVDGGPHGGYFTPNELLFPLRDLNEKLFIPIPFFGPVLRGNLGLPQDLSHKRYAQMIHDFEEISNQMNNVVFVAGHSHNMQMSNTRSGLMQLVVGSGAKKEAVHVGDNIEFGMGEGGFVQLDVYENGQMWASFYAINQEEGKELVYRKQIFEEIFPEYNGELELYKQHPDTIVEAIYDTAYSNPSGFQKLVWGDLHRDIYYQKNPHPVLYLDEYLGGMDIVRRGGGNQTNSLRLADSLNRQYSLRSLRKDGSLILGGVIEGTFAVEALKDIFTFGHPYAAFVIPPLAEAAGIYHTNPKLVYLPKQPRLKHHNELFGNQLYMIEERPDEDEWVSPSFGNSRNVESVSNAQEDLQKNHHYKLDEAFFMRSRFFDYLIGDWDRHEGQWLMAGFEKNGKTVYRPIPRDRDMPFSRFTGLLQVLNKTAPMARQFQSFGPEPQNLKWFWNFAYYTDNYFTVKIDWKTWKEQAKILQKRMTDSVIEAAIHQFPDNVYEQGGAEIVSYMKARRNNLAQHARNYYELLNKEVHIAATNGDNIIEITRLADTTLLEIYHEKKDEKHLVLRRHLESNITKKLFVYGLDDNDEFIVKGAAKVGPRISLIGGGGKDEYIDESELKGWGKSVYVYDIRQKVNLLSSGSETKDMRSKVHMDNVYNHQELRRDYGLLLPSFSLDSDDGFKLGATYSFTNFKFKKLPYGELHELALFFNFRTNGLQLTYSGEWQRELGEWGIALESRFESDEFTQNFFGFGNETPPALHNEDNLNFNRVRKSGARVSPGIFRELGLGGRFQVGLNAEYNKILRDENTVSDLPTPTLGIDPEAFQDQYFSGAFARFEYDSRDDEVYPRRGLLLNIGYRQDYNLGVSDRDWVGKFKGQLAFYQRITSSGSLVLATKSQYSRSTGDYFFYQASAIGGMSSLRGYRGQRFIGESAFVQTSDLRYEAFRVSNRILPFTMGFFGAFDVGRVWQDGVNSNIWHTTYGGGVNLFFIKSFNLNIGYHVGNDRNRILVNAGFNF